MDVDHRDIGKLVAIEIPGHPIDRAGIRTGFLPLLERAVAVSKENGKRIHFSVDDQEVGHPVIIEVGKSDDQRPLAGAVVGRVPKGAVPVPQPDRDGAAHGASIGDRQVQPPVLVQVGDGKRGRRVAMFILGALRKRAVSITQEDFHLVVAQRNHQIRFLIPV